MFSEQERKVFRYEVAGRARWADPLAVWRALLRESGGRFLSWQKDASADRPPAPPDGAPEEIALAHEASFLLARFDAEERCLACVRAAFELPPFDRDTGEGVCEQDCWDVLASFQGWLEKNDSAAGNWPTTSAADSRPEPAGP